MFVRVEHAAAAAGKFVGPLMHGDHLRAGGGGGGGAGVLRGAIGGRVGGVANWGAAKTEPPTVKKVDWSSPRVRPQPMHLTTSCGTVA